ncbi:DHH family phosphoesterase [Methanomassiliicoccaceae archaeon COG_1]|nr:DHH family phosphoesterase [Methanomassiliicoccaceae archaeon COG_1]
MSDDGAEEMSPALLREARRAAAALRGAESVLVVTHIDADGITSGAIAAAACRRLGKRCEVDFEKKITEETVAMINASEADVVWVCDLGSAYMSMFTREGIIVTDHHVPDPAWRSGQTFLDGYDSSYQMNPHLFGVSGAYEVCGAGMTYILAKAIDPANVDLAYLAVVGAVGDFQDARESRLVSWNRIILRDAVGNGDVAVSRGVRWYGRESRPLLQFLQYGDEPKVPGITDDREGCAELLYSYGVEQRGPDGGWRTWSDLPEGDRVALAGALASRLGDPADIGRLIGEVYSIERYEPGSGLHDSKEFATTLNSCGRYDDAATGLKICEGDLSALAAAERNRTEHRRSISAALAHVRSNHLLRKRRYVQYFDAGSEVRETVVGIVAGMVLNSEDADPGMPVIAFADAEDGVKVSVRAPKALVDRGLDLSDVMKEASKRVGGLGGGHSVAAGATIPPDRKGVFLDEVEDLVRTALNP